MSDSSMINVAVVGNGRAGLIHARNLSRLINGARLVCVVDADLDAATHAAKDLDVPSVESDWRDAVDDPKIDAIVIATPTHLHCPIAVAAAEAGKHIFCEKPMAVDGSECLQMIRAADSADVKLQIGFMRRFDSSFVAAKQRVEAGEIGDVVCVKSLTHGPSVPKPWQYDIEKSNGPLAEVNSHDIDTLRWFTESEFSEVYAIAGNYRCPEARADFPDFYDQVTLTARFHNGMQGTIGGAVSVGYGYDARVEVVGTHGVLFIGELQGNSVLSCSSAKGMVREVVPSWRNLFLDAYLREDQHFVDCIRNDLQPRVSGHDGHQAVEVVLAGNRSIVERRPIAMEQAPC